MQNIIKYCASKCGNRCSLHNDIINHREWYSVASGLLIRSIPMGFIKFFQPRCGPAISNAFASASLITRTQREPSS